MRTVAIQEVQDRFDELARAAERGEVVTITRDGKPIVNLVPHDESRRGYDPEGGEAYLRSKGIVRTPGFISEDFDEPLPEDFLLRPLP